FPKRLVRWTSLCVCFALVLTSLAVIPFASVTGKSGRTRRSSPIVREGSASSPDAQGQGNGPRLKVPTPLAGPPPGTVPKLDDLRRATDDERHHERKAVHAPDPIPSTRARWRYGQNLLRAEFRGQSSEVRSSATLAVRSNHARGSRLSVRGDARADR